jgi:hypothetical protein
MFSQYPEFEARWRQDRFLREAADLRLVRLARRPALTPTHPTTTRLLARFAR